MITTHTKISEHRASSRLWVESHRLSQLGFEPGQRLAVDTLSDRLRITPDDTGPYTVSYKRANGIQRPVLDINSDDSLRPLVGFEEATLRGSHRQLIVKPSVRATHIRKAQLFSGDVRVLDLFAGAGSLSFAASSVEGVSIVGGVEHDPSFADIWCKRHTGAELILSDISRVRPEDLPDADLWQIGLPCTSHSTQGRAKKKLAGRPEDGDSGWLFAPTLSLIAARMPTAVLIENVPAFQGSLAHSTITSTLKALGYHVSETVLEPHAEWGEITDRRRWVLTASLKGPFEIESPGIACSFKLSEFLDPADDARDKHDCDRIRNTITGLQAKAEVHSERGNGWRVVSVDGACDKVPTIQKSYHKINMSGAFVKTAHGLRLFRKSELERIHGWIVDTPSESTAIQAIGQGVLARVFSNVVEQIKNHLNT